MTRQVLRDYQKRFVADVEREWKRGVQRVAGVLPTGGGKTTCFVETAERWLERNPGRRVVAFAHRTELVEQAAARVKAHTGLAVGIVKASLNQTRAPIVVASVQTLASREGRRARMIPDVGLAIVDECFSAGTMVGDRPIERLRVGDLVPSWDESTGERVMRRVTATMRKVPTALVRVSIADGTSIVCTPNHPFLTAEGWCPAALLHGADVVSFRHGTAAIGTVRGVRHGVRDDAEVDARQLPAQGSGVLLASVRPGLFGAVVGADDRGHESQVGAGAYAAQQSDGAAGGPRADGRDVARGGSPAGVSRGQRQAGTGTATTARGVSGLGDGGGDRAARRLAPISLPGRRGASVNEGRDRGGRGIPLLAGTPSVRPAQGFEIARTRVVGVQVLERRGDDTYGGLCGDGFVYNVEVDGTHTYLIGDGVVVHNCHRAAARTYREALETFGCMGEGGSGLALGVTATLSRSDRLSLGAVWQSVVEGPTIMEMIGRRWLVRPRGLAVRVEDLDLRNVRIVAGEYRKEDLGEALEQSLAPKRIAEAYREHAADRPGIVFAPTVASAEAIMAALCEAGFTAELVHGGTPADERRAIIDRYRRRETQILCNCAVFTEGTDLPLTSCVVIARKTRHNGPYIQMAGRGLRTSPETGKVDCLILDVVGVTREHRLQAQVDLFGDDYGFDRPESAEDDELEADMFDGGSIPPLEPLEFEVTVTGGEVRDRGVLVADPVDLFHGAAVGWARTQAGAWFLPTRERFLVVLPTTTPGAWGFDVWSVPKDVTAYWVPVAMARGDLNEARTQAEACVTSGERVSQRAGWRRADPSPATVRLAMRLGVAPGFGGMTAGELSAEIDRVQASRRIDPHLPASMFASV